MGTMIAAVMSVGEEGLLTPPTAPPGGTHAPADSTACSAHDVQEVCVALLHVRHWGAHTLVMPPTRTVCRVMVAPLTTTAVALLRLPRVLSTCASPVHVRPPTLPGTMSVVRGACCNNRKRARGEPSPQVTCGERRAT